MNHEIKLKVCGMRDERNIREVASLGIDYMGFIFYKKSLRYVGDDLRITESLEGVKRVGVFVNESTETILKRMKECALDYLQLHGDETVEQCEELKGNKAKIIKVFAADDQMDFARTKPYQEVSDFFLFDTKGKYYGGNAQTFDWNILKTYDQKVPFFLSGGIGPENVSAVKNLQSMNLHAIDVNSGVEVSPGLKDVVKIKRLQEILNSKS